jgi:exosortase family protein XrtF
MIELIRKNKQLIQFLLLCISAYLIWSMLYNQWIGPDRRVDFWLSKIEAKEVQWILHLMGYPTELVMEYNYKHLFYYEGKKMVGVAHACNGLVLFPLFSFFILLTNGVWKRKFIYIVMGCILIYHVNILRITALFFVKLHNPAALEFNHKYTFTILVYGFIFYLWHLWVKRFSGHVKEKDE